MSVRSAYPVVLLAAFTACARDPARPGPGDAADGGLLARKLPRIVSAFDLSGRHDHEQYVELALDRATVTSGQRVKLSIKARKKNPTQREIVAVVSTLGAHSYIWPLLVMMR